MTADQTKQVITDEQLQHCFDLQQDVDFWVFGKNDTTSKITDFNEHSVRAGTGNWYVREVSKFFVVTP